MKVLENLLYTKEHEWLKVDGNTAYIGITDYAQHSLGDVVFVELPEDETELNAGDGFGVVESVKAASDIYSPISGKVLKANQDIVDDPSLLNQDAYENWMIQVELSDLSELNELMNAGEYTEFIGKE